MQPQQQPYSPQSGPNAYDFIVNPAKAPRRSLMPGGGSTLTRLLVVLGSIVVVMIIFAIVKNAIVASSSNKTELLSTVKQQQELIHLTSEALLQTSLHSSTKNFAVTAQVSLASEQRELLAYMKTQHIKVSAKQLAATISPATDQQLTAAASASNYDATFREIVTTKLATYKQTLQQAHGKTTGPHGRTLLSQDFDSAELMLHQLNPALAQ